MAIPLSVTDREYQKFAENTAGETAVRTISEGDFTLSGLRNGFVVKTFNVSTTAVKIPATAQTDRNSIIIWNTDVSKTLYLGPANTVEANDNVGSVAGWQIAPLSYFSTDVTDAVEFWGIASSGTIKVQTMEVS